jgi:flagellar protein FlaG
MLTTDIQGSPNLTALPRLMEGSNAPGAAPLTASGNAQSGGIATQPLTQGQARDLVNSINAYLQQLQTSIGFSIDDSTGTVVVKIINTDTKQVIRQIPPEDLLVLRKKMAELTGLLFDKKV